MLLIWHNPRCTKSRQTLTLIQDAGVEVEVRLYLTDAPSVDEIGQVLALLGLRDPRDMMRRGEKIYKELALKEVTDSTALIAAMAENPILIERPIVSNREIAVIGRPPERVNSLL